MRARISRSRLAPASTVQRPFSTSRSSTRSMRVGRARPLRRSAGIAVAAPETARKDATGSGARDLPHDVVDRDGDHRPRLGAVRPHPSAARRLPPRGPAHPWTATANVTAQIAGERVRSDSSNSSGAPPRPARAAAHNGGSPVRTARSSSNHVGSPTRSDTSNAHRQCASTATLDSERAYGRNSCEYISSDGLTSAASSPSSSKSA